MISRTLAADLPAHVGEHVGIAGWLHRKRQLKSMTFLIVRDRSGLAQVVLTGPAAIAAAAALPEETVIAVEGTVTASPQAPGGAEITEPVITQLSGPAAAPPFDLYRPSVTAALPAILDDAPTTLRHPRLRAPFEISAASAAGFRARLGDLGFTEIHTPKIVGIGDRVGRQRVRHRLLRHARPTWRSRRSSTSRRWSACSSGSSRSGRSSGPSRTTRPGTWRSTPAWTPSSASSPTTTT